MTQQKPEGDTQCFEISSSSDLYSCPIVSKFLIRGRPTYRRALRSPPASYPNRPPNLALGAGLKPNLALCEMAISTRVAVASLLVIFCASLTGLILLYKTFPKVTEDEYQHLKLPWNIEDAKNLGIVLNRYKVDHYFQVMSGVLIAYIFLQTFAIPGSLFLSILSGFLFPFTIALTLICTCSAVGASLCFLLSQLLGRRLILKYFPARAQKWAEEVHKHRENLFNYILFLRITPILPNWFINLTAPVIGVPLVPFALGTFFGVAPPSFVAIQGGQTLQSLTADDFKVNVTSILVLGACAIVPLLPVVFKRWFKKKVE